MDARVLSAAVKQKALILEIKGELYAASWFDVGWWIWKLEENAGEYFVDRNFDRCTCESFKRDKQCKHIEALRKGQVKTKSDKRHTRG